MSSERLAALKIEKKKILTKLANPNIPVATRKQLNADLDLIEEYITELKKLKTDSTDPNTPELRGQSMKS
jgi:Asp-tRNA(Asn)/Glu-tRNA(Gln) amidotransferase C subunit